MLLDRSDGEAKICWTGNSLIFVARDRICSMILVDKHFYQQNEFILTRRATMAQFSVRNVLLHIVVG